MLKSIGFDKKNQTVMTVCYIQLWVYHFIEQSHPGWHLNCNDPESRSNNKKGSCTGDSSEDRFNNELGGRLYQAVCIDVISYFIESQMSKDEQAK